MSDELECEFTPAPKYTNLTSILYFQEFNLEESKRKEKKRQLDIGA